MKHIRKLWWKQCISILLVVALVVTSLYLPADAAAVEELPEGSIVTEDVTDETLADEEKSATDEMEDASGTEDMDASADDTQETTDTDDADALEGEAEEETGESFIDRLADVLGIGEAEEESLEAAVPAETELSGLEADGIPVEQLETDEIPEQEVAPEALILSEVEEEREADSKTFLMSDGNFLVAQYGETIHYEDADGNWEEVDNSVTEADTGTEEEGYETTEKAGNRDRIKFSKKLKEGKTVSIKNTDFPLSWGFAGAQKQTVQIQETYEAAAASETAVLEEEAVAEVAKDAETEAEPEPAAPLAETEKEKAKKHNDKFLRFDDSSEVLVYADIYENIDVTYEVKSTGIKENLILKAPGTKTAFDIAYDIGKLEAVQVDEQTIDLMNGEELIYQIQAPYMKDDAGNYSDKVTLTITEQKNKKLTVTVQADDEWLLNEERVYPVILDPVVFTKTTRDTIDTTFVSSGNTGTNYSGKLELLVGKESSSYKNCRTLVKFTLPKLKPGDMVVDADLNLYLYAIDFYSTGTPALQVNAHYLTGNWDLDSVTWSNQPAYNGTVLDYNYIERNEEGFQPFDITEAVKGWYEETIDNYGILLKSYKEDGSYADTGVKAYFWPERYNTINDAYPIIQIEYRNNKGLEDYWSYTTLSAGTAGTAYINDYTGNLVFVHEDAVTTGNLLPVTLQHVYNGYTMGEHAASSYPNAGRGWRLSVQQTVKTSDNYGLTGDSLTYYPYAYEDGDGTVHFFYKKTENGTTKYFDEDGLGLELKISGSSKTITDKDDNVMTFGPKGHLNSIKDASGNEIKIAYNSDTYDKPQITKVTDGAGHVVKFAEYSTHALKTVTDPAGRVTTFEFPEYNTSGNASLGSVTYPDGTKSTYTYDSNGALLTARSADGSGLKFHYTSDEQGYRVKKVEELATDGTVGQTITFDRSQYNTTLLQTSGLDDKFDTEDDLITTYQFDNWGRTTAAYTKTKNKVHYGGEVASYTSGTVNSSGSNIKQLNKVSNSAYASKNITNYIRNHSAEKTTNWTKSYWSVSGASYTAELSSEQSLFGEKSFKITGTTIPSGSGAMYYQDLPSDCEKPGNYYTLSAYVRTSGVTQANPGDYGACLAVRFTLNGSNYDRMYSEYRTGSSHTAVNKGWTRISMSYQVPSDATNVRVCLLLRNATGTAYFDGIQLESGSSMNPYNMVENASFDRLTDAGKPENWTISSENSSDGYSDLHYFNGGGAMRLEGNGDESKYVYQQVPVTGAENDIYVVSGWARAEAVPDQGDEKRPFDIYVMVYYSDGSSALKSKSAEFNRDVGEWQRVSLAFNLTDGESGNNLTPTKISIGIRYSKQENVAYFDNVQLLKDVSNSYTYDSEGNIITSRESGEQSQAMAYDDASNLTSLTDAENNLYEYEYNDAHQVTEAKSPMGQKVLFTYSGKGVMMTTSISSSGGTMQIKYGKTYSSETDGILAGAYYVKEGDAHGNQTVYDYNYKKGTLKSVTTPDGITTSYTYNANNDALKKVSSGGTEVSYTYDNSGTKLTKITHNGFDYQFGYDKYGNVTTTSVEGNTLVTNNYAEKNGKLTSVSYGNGDTTEYTYNKAGEVETVKENGTKTASWKYDSSGVLIEENAVEAGQKTKYEYDITGRVLRSTVSDASITDTGVDARLYETRYSYDKLDQVKNELVSAGGRTYTAGYSYNENRQPETLTTSNGASKSYSYDALGRLTGKSISTTTAVAQDYVYYTSARNNSITNADEKIYRTTQVARELMGNLGYYYEYDVMGNITKIRSGVRDSGATTITYDRTDATYAYDSKGQLVRENNSASGQTVTYEYDAGGNLKTKKIYPHTTASDLSGQVLTKTIDYTYDSTWKDQLLSYDGEAITYDEIGNPLTYRGATLDWRGRELKSLTKDGTTISYIYGTDGLRTKKTVGNEVHEYYYSGGKLVYEKRGAEEFYYIYDFEGSLSRIGHFNASGVRTVYYPVTNVRGDVQAIFNASGSLAAEYTYDAWGNVTEIRDANGTAITDQSNIGHLNRIRYRGYYYDVETGFYYVSSRYYDPEIGRFISPDTTDILGVDSDLYDKNLYAYCDNNPVMRLDSDGEFWNVAAGAAIGGVLSVVAQVAGNALAGESLGNGVLMAAVTGAASGALSATGLGKWGQAFANAGISLVGETINQLSSGGIKSAKGKAAIKKAAIAGFVGGMIGGNGMRHKEGVYYKTARNAKKTAEKVFSKKYASPKTPSKLLNRAIKEVRKVGYRQSVSTGVKFGIGAAQAQVVTRVSWRFG